MSYQQGEVLINKDGGKRKILGVCGEVYFLSDLNYFENSGSVYTKQDIDNCGYTLYQSEWVPQHMDQYWFVASDGKCTIDTWREHKIDLFRLSIGNVHKTKEAAEAYRERMKSLKI